MRTTRKFLERIISDINESGDCIYFVKLTRRYNGYRIEFYDAENKEQLLQVATGGKANEMLYFLRGFQKGANALKPF